MKTSLFDYDLPPERIAQSPVEPRDASRLMVLHRATGEIEHRHFYEIGDYLQPQDLLVANNSRVIPARLRARKSTGGQAEIFLLRRMDNERIDEFTTFPAADHTPARAWKNGPDTLWRCLVRGRNIRPGTYLTILPQNGGILAENHAQKSTEDLPNPSKDSSHIMAQVLAEEDSGIRIIRFNQPATEFVDAVGEVPLPPYITEYTGDPERYQTVFNQPAGSVAAPTAGLHFTPELLLALRRQEIQFQTVTLHVGLDTFRPVEAEDAAEHPIHSEWAELSATTAQAINQASLAGNRIVAVGTTAVRTLEWGAHVATGGSITPASLAELSASGDACPWQRVSAFNGNVNLFIRPGYRFRAVDALITNFHLPRSTLLMLVSAFAAQPTAASVSNHQATSQEVEDHDKGRRMILAAYQKAIEQGYRFYSFGDAMLII